MKSLLILLFGLFLLTLCCGAVGSFFIFLFDVIRWHRAEKRVIVSASAQELPDELTKESEVLDNGRGNSDDRSSDRSSNGNSTGGSDGDSDRDSGSSTDTRTESGERDSRSFFDSWLQP